MRAELSRKNCALVRSLHTRHGRKKSNCCLCEGVRAVTELCTLRPELVHFAVATERGLADYGRELPCELFLLPEPEFAELAGTVNSQGILAVAGVPPERDAHTVPDEPFLLALDGVGDPGNFGTICRTLRAAGLETLWYTKGSIDPFGDKAIRSAMGAQFALKLRSFADLAALRSEAEKFGFNRFYLTDPHDGESCFAAEGLFDRSVVVIGGEANGATMLENSLHVMIPMPGKFESLNAAQAATVFLFEYVRRNQK